MFSVAAGRSRRHHGQFLQYAVSENVHGAEQPVQLRQQVLGVRGRAYEGNKTVRRRASEIRCANQEVVRCDESLQPGFDRGRGCLEEHAIGKRATFVFFPIWKINT